MALNQPPDTAARIPILGDTDEASPFAGLISNGLRYLPAADADGFNLHALTMTLGTVYGTRIPVPDGEQLTQLAVAMQAEIEDTPVAAQNWLGLYDANGNLLWISADQSGGGTVGPFNVPGLAVINLSTGTFNASGPITGPVTTPRLGQGFVDVAFLGNADTSGLVPWEKTLTTLTPSVGSGISASPSILRAWTGRTGATVLAPTTGAKTGILTVPFAALG